MAKFFCVSDIHSYFTLFIKALTKAGFDKNNENHWLIFCGDCFDRGPESVQLLEYLYTLERAIFIKGNHEELLEDCCGRGYPKSYDISNGTVKTIKDLGLYDKNKEFDKASKVALEKTKVYRKACKNYFETRNYIFVHSWIPINQKSQTYIKNWRTADKTAWYEARWCNPIKYEFLGLNKTNKYIVHGHWNNSAYWAVKNKTSEFDEDAIFDTYIDDMNKVVGLDACTAYTGKVNIFIVDDDF